MFSVGVQNEQVKSGFRVPHLLLFVTQPVTYRKTRRKLLHFRFVRRIGRCIFIVPTGMPDAICR
jgi:hypothetical protein